MSVQNFSFLARLEVAEKFGVGWGGGPGQVKGSALVKLNNSCSSCTNVNNLSGEHIIEYSAKHLCKIY